MEENQFSGVKPSILMEQYKHSFTKSEKKIYDYIQSKQDQVLYHSLTELSESSNVAEATVLRFFRKLGLKGFQEFKFQYAQEVSIPETTKKDDTYVDKIKHHMIQGIENSSEVIDHTALERCVDAIDASDDVVLFGVGSSGVATLDMQNRLMRIGKHVSTVNDPHFQFMRASSMNKDTVVVAISLTGSTKDIVDCVAIAKERNALVIALTNYIKSPLTQYADITLLSAAKESPLDSGSLISKVSQLFLIDLICTGLTIKQYDHAEKVRMEIIEKTARKLY